MAQQTIFLARTCKVGKEEHANYSEDISPMTLGRNQKPFTRNCTSSEEAYQYPSSLPDISLVGRRKAIIHIISALIVPWEINFETLTGEEDSHTDCELGQT